MKTNNKAKYNLMRSKIIYVAVILMLLVVNSAFAQNEDGNLGEQTVIIYNEYTPVLKDANRIQFLPVIIDTVKVSPKFEYNVAPMVYKTDFKPTQITAASIKGEPLKRLDNGMIKLGMGNYLSPFVEVYYNSRREKNFSVGAYVKHQSAHGTIKNVADQPVYAGYNNNLVKAFGKKFLRNSTVSGDLVFSSNQNHFYGYDPYINLPVDQKPLIRSNMEMQRYNRFTAQTGIVSNNTAQKRFDYRLDFAYQYFFTASDDSQHKIKFDADLSKLVKSNRFGVDIGFMFNKNMYIPSEFVALQTEYNEIFLDLDPYFKHYTKDWQIKLGAKTTGEFVGSSTEYHIYPDIYFQHNISNTIIPYAGFKGYLENNNLESISLVNQFVNSRNLLLQSTNYAQVIDVGLKGNISKHLYFHINGNYSKIDNMGFFVNDTSIDLQNKFILEYTNVERFSGYAEFAVRNIGKFSGLLKGHYYYYSYIKSRENAWHMPSFDIYLSTKYQFDEKLSFGLETGVLSTRFAKDMSNPSSDGVKLKPVVDVNLFADYSFASNFSAFIYMNNIAGQKNYYWNNYQSQGFNFMLGIKYLF